MRKLGFFFHKSHIQKEVLFPKKDWRTKTYKSTGGADWKIPAFKIYNEIKSVIFRLQFVISLIQFTKYCPIYHKKKNAAIHHNSHLLWGSPRATHQESVHQGFSVEKFLQML